MKITSRDILDVLKRFELASDDNVPRHVEMLKTTNPIPTNTLAGFRFNRHQFYVLFDESADDDYDYIIKQINIIMPNVKGDLHKNPRDMRMNYALPFKGRACYLFEAISDKKRLDSELAARYPEKSRATWQKYIRSGFVTVNDKVVQSPSSEVTEVDGISITLPTEPDYSDHELPIIYIDDNVVVVNKPVGILTHSKGAINEEFTVADFFRRYTSYNLDTNRPGIVHRLDRDTSGVIIGARNPETAHLLQKQFADRKVQKTYYAILNGVPKHSKANIDLPIGRNPNTPSTFRVDAKGKSAVTHYEIIKTNDDYSLVKLQPKTGRTHQLRVHMKYLNTPILGDRVYGETSSRLYLHAYSLEVTIPSGDRKTFSAPLPDEFNKYFSDTKL